MKNTPSVSIVIPTLGRSQLRQTLESVYSGTIIPSETLLCVPDGYEQALSKYSYPKLRIVIANDKDQVFQRYIGFKNAQFQYVMQLDDDVILDSQCIENLLSLFTQHETAIAVAPSILDIESGQSVYRKRNDTKLNRLLHWMLNGNAGYKQGQVSLSGMPYGVDTDDLALHDVIQTEWLAGGCVMHARENLILRNFYPFSGKAYAEDIYHSYYLSEKGVKLYVARKAKCWIKIEDDSIRSVIEQISIMKDDFRAKKEWQKLTKRQSPRIYLYYLLCISGFFLKRLKRWMKPV